MESEQPRDDEEPQQQGHDESVEEFKEDVENDPSTAKSGDDEIERLRGG